MTCKIKDDGSGQLCVLSDKLDNAWLVLDTVVYDHVRGHAYTVDPQKHALARLSPAEAAKLQWCETGHPRAAPDIFSGEPVIEVEDEAKVMLLILCFYKSYFAAARRLRASTV